MSLNYRADIDGLRAVAVLSVIFFHAGIPGFSGGFVGVDVFFVISGFLITSIILKEIHTSKFSIARFYERRIRRIFPALFPVIAFTTIVGAVIFEVDDFKIFGESITATTFFASNIFFWRQSGYFDAASITKPLLHTWSLAVEEQFYIFFPLLLVSINRYSKRRYFPWLLAMALVSLLASIYGVKTHQMATFYLVPTRTWELLFGSILALGVIPQLQSNFLRNLFSIFGLGLILYSVGYYTEETLFPGTSALVPVLGSCLIIYSGLGGEESFISKLLSLRPMVYIGLISYSLYLWHWPLFAFAKYLLLWKLVPFMVPGLIIVTFIISALSLKFIEHPFRGATPIITDRKNLFVLSSVVMLVASSVGGLIYWQRGIPDRIDRFFPGMTVTLLNAQDEKTWTKNGELEKLNEKINAGVIPPTVGNIHATPVFALCGDSHARALIPAFTDEANRFMTRGYTITRNGTPFLSGIDITVNKNDDSVDESRFNRSVLDFIKAHAEIGTVILVGRWAAHIKGNNSMEEPFTNQLKDTYGEYDGNTPKALLLKAGLSRTVHAILAMGRKVILLSDVPEIGYDVPRFYSVQTRFPFLVNGVDIRPTIAEYNERQREVQIMLMELAKLPNVTLINPELRMFDKNGRGRIMENGELLYRDDDHLSTSGAHFVAPAFDELFRQMSKQ